MESSNLLEFVKACPFFYLLEEDDLQVLLHHGKFNMFAKGKTITKVGDHSMEMFFIVVSGEIAIIAKDGDVLQKLEPGSFVSDLDVSLFLEGKRGAIQAIKPTELFVWHVGVIKKHLPMFIKRIAEES
jgi:signal-transduction protein with cAMP-binding, CBS, and nucleotidyltransferase domain